MSTDQIQAFYLERGPIMIDGASFLGRNCHSYNDEPLAALLRMAINEALGLTAGALPVTLGNGNLRTLPVMVIRNNITATPWSIATTLSPGARPTRIPSPSWLAASPRITTPPSLPSKRQPPPLSGELPTGADKLLVFPVGTGSTPRARANQQAGDLWLLNHPKNTPSALVNTVWAGWDMAIRIVGECRFGGPIDSVFGDMLVWTDGAAIHT